MADEYENYEVFDNALAENIIVKLKELGMMPIDASCRIDYMGRMTVEAEVFDGDRDKIKKNAVVTEISKNLIVHDKKESSWDVKWLTGNEYDDHELFYNFIGYCRNRFSKSRVRKSLREIIFKTCKRFR